MAPYFRIPLVLAPLKWHRASHAAGFGTWFAEVTPQRASFLVRRFRQSVAGLGAPVIRMPTLGREMLLLGLGDIGTRFWLVNRSGRYSVEAR